MRNFVLPLIAWTAMVACWVLGVRFALRDMSVGPEEKMALLFSFVVGCLVVLLCWPVCRVLRRVHGAAVGFALGLIIPIIAGLMWGRLPKYYGMELVIPSGIGGAVVGVLQAKHTPRSPAKQH